MNLSLTSIAFVAIFVGGCVNVFAQASYDKLSERLPPANKRLLAQLSKTGLSDDWDKPRSRGINRSLSRTFTSSDQIAWQILESRFVLRDSSNDDWRTYWRWISFQRSEFPTQTIDLQGHLIRLPTPQVSGSATFPETHPEPLPGDAVLFNGTYGVVCGVWWGNKTFPRRNKYASFFYYNYEPFSSSNTTATDVEIFGGTSFNTYPPRITPELYKVLFPKTVHLMKPHGELFIGANGYLATSRKNAYAGYYMPSVSDGWQTRSPGFIVLRRRSPERIDGASDGVVNAEPEPLTKNDAIQLLSDIQRAISMINTAMRRLQSLETDPAARAKFEEVIKVSPFEKGLNGEYRTVTLNSYSSIRRAAQTLHDQLKQAISGANGAIIKHDVLSKQVSIPVTASGNEAFAYAVYNRQVVVSESRFFGVNRLTGARRSAVIIHELAHYELNSAHSYDEGGTSIGTGADDLGNLAYELGK